MRVLVYIFGVVFLFPIQIIAQKTYQSEGYKFSIEFENQATSIKDQALSNTCWSFSTLSMIESELLKEGKDSYDLSEMYIVYFTYLKKAEQYIRMHGNNSFSGGGALDDPVNIMKEYGIVPEAAYLGRKYDFQLHNHEKLDEELKTYMDKILSDESLLSTFWMDSVEIILQEHLGKIPGKFKFNDQDYDAIKFAKELDIHYDDYVLLSSFSHHPFYSKFILEVPDNWNWGEVYNVKMKEITRIIDYALKNGYTVAWAADVSEDYFSWEDGVAVIPESSYISKDEIFKQPGKEMEITQEIRQKAFDSYETTDDHGMQIIGLAKDQKGSDYYLVKNSWGTLGNKFNGYLFISKSYVEYKTLSFYLNKKAIPKDIRIKLGI